eukprot:Em0020g575a
MAAQSFPPPSSNLSSKVELSVSCSNLKNLDHFSKSDPVVFLYCRGREVEWTKVGRTELIENNLNPKFSTTFSMEYRFEEVQNLQFAVYDVDDKQHVDNIDKQQLLGAMECTLAEVMAAGEHLTKSLRLQGNPAGKITIQAEEVQDSKFVVAFELSATKLEKKDLFGKSDPYIEIAKAQEGGAFTVVYRSQPIMKTLSPRWPAFQMEIQKLCSGDWERTLQFSVWDWNKSGNNELIGLATTSLKDICPERGGKVFDLDLTNPSHKGKKKSTGVLVFNSVKAVPIASFVDYIKGGCQISLITAVDFTASNGNPSDPNCLHYISPVKDNEYLQAIKSVGSVLAPYDSDQMIPSFGFGGQIPPHFQVSHCFPLDLNTQNPEVYGVQGIVNAYQHAVHTVRLCGPTNFSSILDTAMRYASVRENQQSQNYFILLIITDGEITDMANTVDRIVAASKLPLSIVIVGVGGADFKNMEILDADDTPLRSRNGQTMARDIVQFVPFRELMRKAGPNGCVAKETLAEIPGQLMAFMKANNIRPNPPVLRRSETTVYSGQPGPAPYSSGPQGPAPYPSGPQVVPKVLLPIQVDLKVLLLIQVDLKVLLLIQVDPKVLLLIQVDPKVLLPIQVDPKVLLPIQVVPKVLLPIQVDLKVLLPIRVDPKVLLLIQVDPKLLLLIQVDPKVLLPIQVDLKLLLPIQVDPKVLFPIQVYLKVLLPIRVDPKVLFLIQVDPKLLLLIQVDPKVLLPIQVDLKVLLPIRVDPKVLFLIQVDPKLLFLIQVDPKVLLLIQVDPKVLLPVQVHLKFLFPIQVHLKFLFPTQVHLKSLFPIQVHLKFLFPIQVLLKFLFPIQVLLKALSLIQVLLKFLFPIQVLLKFLFPIQVLLKALSLIQVLLKFLFPIQVLLKALFQIQVLLKALFPIQVLLKTLPPILVHLKALFLIQVHFLLPMQVHLSALNQIQVHMKALFPFQVPPKALYPIQVHL